MCETDFLCTSIYWFAYFYIRRWNNVEWTLIRRQNIETDVIAIIMNTQKEYEEAIYKSFNECSIKYLCSHLFEG